MNRIEVGERYHARDGQDGEQRKWKAAVVIGTDKDRMARQQHQKVAAQGVQLDDHEEDSSMNVRSQSYEAASRGEKRRMSRGDVRFDNLVHSGHICRKPNM